MAHVYRNNLKNRELGKEAAQILRLEQATIAYGKARVKAKKMLPSRQRQKSIVQVVSVYTKKRRLSRREIVSKRDTLLRLNKFTSIFCKNNDC
jgi:hypothetical protein